MLAFVGDIAFTGLISTDPKKNGIRFNCISPILNTFDLVFANFEAPVKTIDERNDYKQNIHFADPQVTRDLLQRLNIGCVSLANNHIYDCKMSGLKATIDLLDELGIFHTGAGWKEEHVDPLIINRDKLSIGFIAYIDKSTNPKTENYPELLINYFDLEKVKKDIEKLRSHVDKIICSIHWGMDYSYYPTPMQLVQARRVIDSGVDIIMGHHPHTIQAYENYKKGHIFYSLGSLTFGDFIWEGKLRALKRKTKIGMIGEIATFNEVPVKLIATKELQGNKIKLLKKNMIKWSRIHLIITKLMAKSKLFRFFIIFKETWIDRIWEFLFGYYRQPLKDFFNKKNWKKICFLKRDYVKQKKH